MSAEMTRLTFSNGTVVTISGELTAAELWDQIPGSDAPAYIYTLIPVSKEAIEKIHDRYKDVMP